MRRIETFFSKYDDKQLVDILDDYTVAARQIAPRDYCEKSEILKEPFAHYFQLYPTFSGAVSRLYQDLIYEFAMRYLALNRAQ